jgi:PAS domain S-box-containing protein
MRDKFSSMALRWSLIYAIVASLWILFSDLLLAAFVSDPKTITVLSICIDWSFVAITAWLLYLVMRHQLKLQEWEITGRKGAEDSLQKTNRALHMISNCKQILIRATDEIELLKNICRLVVVEGGNAMAWVGYAGEDEAKSVPVMAQAGLETGYLETLQITWAADVPRGRGPTGTAIRTGRVSIFRNLDKDHEFAPWREQAQRCGYQSAIGLPLTVGNQTFGALTIYSTRKDAFDEAEAGLLLELADDLAFGLGALRSLAEHRRTEQALRESEERLRLAQTAAKTGIFDVDLVRDYATWTEEAEAVFGFAPGTYDHASETFWQLLHPEDRERIRQITNQAIADHSEFEAEYRFHRHGDNALRWSLVRGRAVYDKSGRPVRLLGVNIDITELKNAELALRMSEALYHSLVEQMPAGIFRKDAEGRYVFVNSLYCQIKGMKAEDFLGKRPGEVAAAEAAKQDPEGVATKYAAKGEEIHARIIQTGKSVEAEEEYSGPDGRKQFMHVVRIPVRAADGKVIGTQGILFDITQLKQAEEAYMRLATAVEQAAEDIMITDATGKILYVNPAFEKISGYTRTEAIGQNPRLLKSGKHDAAFYQRMWAMLAHGGVWSGHFINKKKNGTLFEEEATISPIRDSAGKIINYVAVRRDVTREVALEAQLRQAQKMEAIGTLAGGVAHDFNNVLAAILGSAELIKMDIEPEHPAREFLDQIFLAGKRAREVVQQILTFSQRRESERSVIHLQPVVKECVKLLRSTIPAMVDVSCHFDPDCSPVLADPAQIHQVIMNLCTNAWQALPENHGSIRVNLEMCEIDELMMAGHPDLPAGPAVRLSICDNGSGMDKATLERMFEPFFTTKPVGEGSGLGLAVVHGIVKAHQGVITVESEPGKGTVFNIYLPPQASEEEEAPAESEIVLRGNQERILFVDDDELAGRAMEKVLNRFGYQVKWFQHPEEALAHFNDRPAEYDLVITDLAMPGMTGDDLAAALVHIRPNLPILLTTGVIDPAILKRTRAIGVCNVLLKPVSAARLAREIAQQLAVRGGI